MKTALEHWERYKRCLYTCPELGFSLDISRMHFDEDDFESMRPRMERAFSAMQSLEGGAIANPDENRMVGHYWLRAPELSPATEIRADIERTQERIGGFASDIHEGRILSERGEKFERVLVIGIGGSALGPQLVGDALGGANDAMAVSFCDNTDSDGFDRTFAEIGIGLSRTLSIVISKSGGTKETRNGMMAAQEAYRQAGIAFSKHAVAVTGNGSALDNLARQEGWLERFPMWDWVGGRTSAMSAVGLLPAALQGLDTGGLLSGAARMDQATRVTDITANPAALLALMWFDATGGKGERDMIVLPYKDRLVLFSKYLQQLVMESIGKELDLEGNVVHQGIAVYGNKGSTDQHAYVQQLRDGVNNFFVTFLEVLRDSAGPTVEVEPDVTSGDYLSGFLQGTRQALADNGRESITITLSALDASGLGALIALFERTVGLYASLVNVNAYHQPGVEAGKKAAAQVLELQVRIIGTLRASPGEFRTAEEVADGLGCPECVETISKVLEHLSANLGRGIARSGDAKPWQAKYAYLER